MAKNRFYKLAAAPVLLAGLAAPVLFSSGCGDDACDAQISVRFETLQTSANALISAAAELKGSVGLACATIAGDLGSTDVPSVTNWSTASDDDITAACNAATASIQLELDAGVTITLAISGGECHVNAEAQFSCEANCSVDATCDPGTIDVRCDPGELSGQCSGTCEANASCQGSITAEANCSGTCGGECNGTCDAATSSGAKCDGRCEGTCTGECVLAADANINCGANVDCKGGCNVAYTAPQCEGTLEPPSCSVDADCQAGCEGQANFEAECTPPVISVEITGGASANLQATLEANLPEIFAAFQLKGALVVEAAGGVASAFGGAVDAMISVPGCVLKYGEDFAASVTGSVEASASVSVSVNASADVGTTASGG
jgi:hypothetical protein